MLVLIAGARAARPAGGSFAACDTPAGATDARAAARCIYEVARREGDLEGGARRLDEHLARPTRSAWFLYYRGNVEWLRGGERATDFYRRAAGEFARTADAEGEVVSRTGLRDLLVRQGRLDEAAAEVERATRVAEAASDPQVRARGLLLRGKQLWDTGADLGRATRLLRTADQAFEAAGNGALRLQCLTYLGNVLFDMARYRESIDTYQRLEPIARALGNARLLATTEHNVANALRLELEERPRPGGREEVLARARKALDTAEAAGDPLAEPAAHRMIGELLAATPAGRGEALHHLESCLGAARRNHGRKEEAHCLWALGRYYASADPPRARRLLDQALTATLEVGSPTDIAIAWRERMHLSWEIASGEALDHSMQALDAIEHFRELQPAAGSRAAVFSRWVRDYLYVSGQLLRGESGVARDGGVERAFSVTERMRARVLLETLGSAKSRVSPGSPRSGGPGRAELLGRITALQRRALNPRLTRRERSALERELAQLELEEASDRLGLPLSAADDARARGDALLSNVRAALGDDEAMLSFQLGLWEDLYGRFGGGSWLLAITRGGTRLHKVPDATQIDPAVAIFTGLVGRGGREEGRAAARLYRDLLGEALAGLSPRVRRLVVVPDAALHHLPLGALRPAADGEPLALRYELALTPSATLWLRWRTARPSPSDFPAVALVDPPLGDVGGSRDVAEERGWPLLADGWPGRLPYARREGRALRRHLGPRTRLLVGEEASERFVKQADLTRFGVLHFAAHAVVDEANPQRSAILLAPGGSDEDGLLQLRELSDLDLDGRLVVLSACRGASGSLVRGEGTLSLARGFLQAGARSVVASLWPLRDSHAAAVFDDFYRYLGQGGSVAASLRAAQEDAWRRGLGPEAWASLVIFGDGAHVPTPAPPPSPSRLRPWALLAVAVTLAAALGFAARQVARQLRS